MNWWRNQEIFTEGYLDNLEDVQKRSKFLKSLSAFPQNISDEQRTKFYSLWADELENYGLANFDEQILKLKNSQALMVTTGQQAVIGGGPLLVFYKALSAIDYAQLHSTEETPVYPLFWIAGDDSDFEEVNQFEILAEDQKFSFSQVDRPIQSPVGHYHLTHENVQEWKAFVEATSLRNPIKSRLLKYFKVGDTLVQSMGAWLAEVFRETPLLIIDGGGEAVRSCESQLLSDVLHQNNMIQQRLTIQSSRLKGLGIKTQVPLDEEKVRLFELKEGQRQRIFSSYKTVDVDLDEIVHDALSRPFLLEKLFPILGHVLGPAELKYFALIQPCFELLNTQAPLVIKRFNSTILTQNHSVLLKDLGVSKAQLNQLTYSQLARCLVRSKYLETIDQTEKFRWNPPSIKSEFLSEEDKQSLQQSMESSLRLLEKKWVNKVEKKLQQNDQELQSDAKKLSRWLGSARVQERHMTWWEASNVVSLSHMNLPADPRSENHQIITLNEVFE